MCDCDDEFCTRCFIDAENDWLDKMYGEGNVVWINGYPCVKGEDVEFVDGHWVFIEVGDFE